MLLDAFVSKRTAGQRRFDDDGALALRGRADDSLLAAMLRDDYFAASPPKTTGRERFGEHFLDRFGDALGTLSTQDGAATLSELTAARSRRPSKRAGFARARVIVSGGGARNRALMTRLSARLPAARVEPSDVMGFPVDAKEAIAFAVLGYETLAWAGGQRAVRDGSRASRRAWRNRTAPIARAA